MNDHGLTDKQEADADIDYSPNWRTPQCCICKHNVARHRGDVRCAAFGNTSPPTDLVYGGVSHTLPYPGDGGLRWLPDTDAHRAEFMEMQQELREVMDAALVDGLELPPGTGNLFLPSITKELPP